MAEHKDLDDVFLHEPKGIVNQLPDYVYVSDGNGSGVWKALDTLRVDVLAAYAESGISTNDPPISVGLTTANDQTLLKFEDYVSFTQDMNSSITPENMSIEPVSGEFIAEVTGVYVFNFWMSEENNLSNEELAIAFFVNQDYQNLSGDLLFPVRRDRTKTSAEITATSFSGLLNLTVSDRIGLAMASTGTGNVSISDCEFGLHLIKETV